jgi:hypothetical protein
MCSIWEKSQNKWVERGAMTMSNNVLWFHPLPCSPSSSGSLDVGGACGGNEAQVEKINVDTHPSIVWCRWNNQGFRRCVTWIHGSTILLSVINFTSNQLDTLLHTEVLQEEDGGVQTSGRVDRSFPWSPELPTSPIASSSAACKLGHFVCNPRHMWNIDLIQRTWWGRDSRSSVRFKITIDLVGSDTPI